MANDICKLTGERGSYVRSHLIPKAFTRPEEPGLPLMQAASGQRVKKRWDSWYDMKLVTQQGENILSEFDDWAVKYLRAQKLVWGGWGPMTSLANNFDSIPGTPWGIRKIKVDDPDKLRLFFFSLLWRAAASKLSEFVEVELPKAHLIQLGEMLKKRRPGPIDFYPITLTQLSTKGVIHNLVPLAQVKHIPEIAEPPAPSTKKDISIFRFYFDGLIAHIHRHAADDGYTSSLSNFVVGAERELLVSTVTYEHSFERENLSYIMAETIFSP